MSFCRRFFLYLLLKLTLPVLSCFLNLARLFWNHTCRHTHNHKHTNIRKTSSVICGMLRIYNILYNIFILFTSTITCIEYYRKRERKREKREKRERKKRKKRTVERKIDTNTQHTDNTINSKQPSPQLHRNKQNCSPDVLQLQYMYIIMV